MNHFINLSENKAHQDKIKFILSEAKKNVEDHTLLFAGSLKPQDAWLLFQSQQAIIIDVRTHEERKFVGYVEHTEHIPWLTGISLERNPEFLEKLQSFVNAYDIILLMCRSGKRSAAAASVAYNAGFTNVYNIDQGFEGDLDPNSHRGTYNGWRFHNLPWVQE
ncbi:rhodanese-like domain-containing protein [Acinetobacter sp. YH16032]|uniref:rhodanese-like domain-containing protein n=1 Tax=Acinetobacter sp. YH16032 TaxID=2601181 RepID=UPI0015D3173F|nr:rhodanese-like domain-containing protein [Acinetobacter sp. YH16032]